ncbi:ElyC/SanA/YdcF family protein [Rariglobus hedericola]|uniref:DUF218 domain-containing protein n=1 Tax=Rariglobus hedericola TaxID=2597822 RepID=A0A556QQF2_9BACT|nr:ElyC/SanA/YdcF family protein [Rariglobus hedericola]TSJ78866.1 hypothetical protein FPL22_06065 [Rariglobus hedericola]
MLFWLKKVAGYWLMPLPLSVALIIGGVVLMRFTRRKRLGRGFALVGGLWLLVCSNSGIGTWFVRGLEAEYPSQPTLTAGAPLPDDLARCEFVVVLGGGNTHAPEWPANNQLSASALSRIVEGVRLVRQMPQARLIVSGPNDAAIGGPSHARLLADVAVSLGVPRERILEISSARDTEQEAVAIRALAGDAPVALVTSAWHLPRAMALCRRQGIDAVACPADYAGRDIHPRFFDFFTWNVGGLERSTKAVYEVIGATWSQLRGKT